MSSPEFTATQPTVQSSSGSRAAARVAAPPSRQESPARLIAFYLPQFHPIPENDAWWGKGFTEWTNVARAKPLFPGHYQPHLPADLGFYDLRVPETRAAQAELAAKYGITGFCYWHYWFGHGRRLLERPFTEVLRSGEPDFPFCLAWANQSWTGIWHGAPNRILMEQTYPGKEDHERHFNTLLEAFTDPRYITVDGKPVFLIYQPLELPEPKQTFDFWRDLAVQAGLPGLHIIGLMGAEWQLKPRELGLDGFIINRQTYIRSIIPEHIIHKLSYKFLRMPGVPTLYEKLLRRPFDVYLYEDQLPYFIVTKPLDFEYYPCVVPNWDNTPRSGMRGVVLHNSTPELFELQVNMALERVAHLPAEQRLVFVKSWNEWAEGNHLEPDLRFGRGYLEAVQRALRSFPVRSGPTQDATVYQESRLP